MCTKNLSFFRKFKKMGGCGVWVRGQGGCERIIEVL